MIEPNQYAPPAGDVGGLWEAELRFKVGSARHTFYLDPKGNKISGQYTGRLVKGPLKGHIAERSFTIATFALCGFANFSSIGIQIGGIGALAPSRKQDLARLGFRALIAGTLANYMAAAIAGLLLA